MATSSTSPASVASLTAPPTFTGVSNYATSLQQVLTRSVAIASLPLDADQATLTSLNTTQSDLQGLDTVFTTLQQNVVSLQSALTSSLLTSSLSDANTVSATVGPGATAGTYSIAVGSVGSYSTALSVAGSTPVTDPTSQGISTSTTYTLTVGATPTTITSASSDLQDLASAINSQAGGQVQATLVNVGSTSSPDYRLSLQAVNLGTDTIGLTDSSDTNLITPPTATALSIAGSPPVTDPTTSGISSSTTFTLTVGSATPITITPASTDLQDLASAINSQSDGEVTATLVNVGSTSSPDYRLSLLSTNLVTGAIDLTDSSDTNLTSSSTTTTGSLASYEIDGQSPPITSTSRTITLSTGLQLTLLAKSASGASTTVTVADNPAALASAFSTFAGSYNAAVDAIAQYHGAGGGALEGDSILQTLSGVLTQLGNYNNGTPASALANFGITLDETGQLSVNTTAFTTAANANFPTLLSTLGGATTGGFLQAATNLLTGVEDPATGALKVEEASVASQITNQQATITNEQARVTLLQTNLTQQIAQADTAIAEMETQVTYVTGLFAQYTGTINNQNNGLTTL
jgi:flagellar hook-associated protein 2